MTRVYLSSLSLGSEPISRSFGVPESGENSHLICVTALVEVLQGQEMLVFIDGPECPIDAVEAVRNRVRIAMM